MNTTALHLRFVRPLLAGIACTLLASLPLPAPAVPASDTATAIRVALPSAVEGPATSTLRVCADPNNLPFSNKAGEGFENRIAQILARDLHAKLEYTWWAQRRGFARNTVRADRCDLWIGVASGVQTLATTRPYYRSTYVFVTREDRKLDIRSFDDPRLRSLRIGVQMIGNDAQNTPPAHALARRGITGNVRGFMVYGDYAKAAPEAPIVAAVADGDIDVAVVWGPLAGYFARHSDAELRLDAVEPPFDGPQLPMAFDIAVGVRRDDAALRARIDEALVRERGAIDRVLDHYGVPRSRPVGGAGAVAEVD